MDANGTLGPVQNYVRPHPSYLKTLSQDHSGWTFGAIAELVDNSRDAKARALRISIDNIYSVVDDKEIPMLSVLDDGHGMTHGEILRMVTFGHKQPIAANDPDHIGRFSRGFMTGAMRLGKDALVLTQVADSISIAFLSQSLNEGKDNLETPIVSYSRKGRFMGIDTSVQSETLAKQNLKAIKEYSMFNEYFIGEKVAWFDINGTGTQIYIWNLEEGGSNFCLGWDAGMIGGSSSHPGDITTSSRRNQSRPGQMVPIDFSLRSYLEVIFKDPHMKIFVQGSQVKSRPLAKILSKTVVKNGKIMGKPVQLALGFSQSEWELGNCGMFLYWHGRLIEAYKRVGEMVRNGDKSRGLIGVIDVTDVMNDGKGGVWMHSNKQGFPDCEVYDLLEQWLGKKADEYLDNNLDNIGLKKCGSLYKPDHELVQCDKCREWRMLSPDFDSKRLPQEWLCYMKPYYGKCKMPDDEVERGVITSSSKRSRYGLKPSSDMVDWLPANANCSSKGESDECSLTTVEDTLCKDFSLSSLRNLGAKFCCMEPFYGKCEMLLDEEAESGVITPSSKRFRNYDIKHTSAMGRWIPEKTSYSSRGEIDESSRVTVEDILCKDSGSSSVKDLRMKLRKIKLSNT